MKQPWFAAVMTGAAALAMAQEPHVVNAHLSTAPGGAGLAATVSRLAQSGGPVWLGYEVAAVPGSRVSACPRDTQPGADEACCGVYRLEGTDNTVHSSGEGAVRASIDVLARIDHGTVDRVRIVGAGCPVDVGGLPFTWLPGVGAQESLTWLSSLVTKESEGLGDPAVMAIALHETPQATAVLSGFAAAANPPWLREKGGFWLGAARGHDGLVALEQLMHEADADFRTKLAFDVSVSHEPAAVDDLIRLARSDADAGVREQALFWVAQKAGAKAVATLRAAVADDPQIAVKKKAVFALSRLPEGQAVTELLQVAQSTADRAIRREAIFWLGQTHDPRALAYFRAILER